ncbi:MAG: 5'/3'-nucleotidase SurE [Candidatus Cryptobacteroides sp.]
MPGELKILITNDDGFEAKGIAALVDIMRQFGSLTVIAPKKAQSGMSMAVTMGGRPLALKRLRSDEKERWFYLDASPASCVKYGLDNLFWPEKPDVVICGINHGSNAATAANYSGTLGAAEEAAMNGIPGIGVSLETTDPDADFSSVVRYFPGIFRKLLSNLPERGGIFYNVNFPSPSLREVKGVRVGHMGTGHWEKEFCPWTPETVKVWGKDAEALGFPSEPACEEGEELVMMVGDFVDDTPCSDRLADHHIIEDGYVAVTAHNFDNGDPLEAQRLLSLGFNEDFQ